MSERNPGKSLHDKVSGEHRRLEEMFEDLRAALRPQENDAGALPAASKVLEEMREELEAHFDVEERLYYPSLWALRPERKAPLHALLQRHPRFLTQLEKIARSLQAEALSEAETLFDSFASDFALHEDAEETLLKNLEQTLPPT
ncbi:MAG: hemerythrin domain-containing protein [Deltaproteobacteria bacterium]|nr:hemerythrin domain-containing protein [Deltaproteobacteria bacterium]